MGDEDEPVRCGVHIVNGRARECVEFCVKFIRETEKAVLVRTSGRAMLWFPKSQLAATVVQEIEETLSGGEEVLLIMSTWIATEKGLYWD